MLAMTISASLLILTGVSGTRVTNEVQGQPGLQTESLSQNKCVKVYVLPIKIEENHFSKNRIKVLKKIKRGSGEMALPEDRSPPSVTPVPEDLMPSSGLHEHCTYTGKILTHIRGSDLIPRTHSRCYNRLTSLTYNTKIAKHF